MNTLLLYPRCPETFWSFTHALRIARKKAFTPPLGLLTAAALLPSEWPKRLVDLNVADLSNADLQWADLVLISAMTIQQTSARALIARCKQAGKRVVAGGPLFTQSADDFPEVDHFVLDEGELTIPPFVADLQNGTPRRFYRAEGYASLETSPSRSGNSQTFDGMGRCLFNSPGAVPLIAISATSRLSWGGPPVLKVFPR